MNVYIFESIASLTDNYHHGGGAVCVAESLDRAVELIVSRPHYEFITRAEPFAVTDEEREAVVVYHTTATEEAVFIFPDAGCC